MLNNLEILLSRLRNAEYASLMLEPLMLHGLLIAVIFFAIGQYMRQPKCRAAALIAIAACSFSVVPFLSLRHQAQPRELSSRPSDAKLIKEQYQRRSDTKWVYYALAIAAVLSLLGGGIIGKFSDYAVLFGGILVLLFSAWLHMKEAEIYHPNVIQRAVPVH
jgi:bacteriorhodopsin